MFDADAFEIVLLIVHAQAHKLPKEVSLATTTELAIIADDLQCGDPIAPFVQHWGSNNDFWAESGSYGNLIQKIFICSVFQLKERFPSVTHKLIIRCLTQVPALGLPIDPSILRKYLGSFWKFPFVQ